MRESMALPMAHSLDLSPIRDQDGTDGQNSIGPVGIGWFHPHLRNQPGTGRISAPVLKLSAMATVVMLVVMHHDPSGRRPPPLEVSLPQGRTELP
jgi:hypothetical protein